jgi:hypothetical protein
MQTPCLDLLQLAAARVSDGLVGARQGKSQASINHASIKQQASLNQPPLNRGSTATQRQIRDEICKKMGAQTFSVFL